MELHDKMQRRPQSTAPVSVRVGDNMESALIRELDRYERRLAAKSGQASRELVDAAIKSADAWNDGKPGVTAERVRAAVVHAFAQLAYGGEYPELCHWRYVIGKLRAAAVAGALDPTQDKELAELREMMRRR